MMELPDGSRTDDGDKFSKAWEKAGLYLAKKLGFRLRDSFAHLTFEETYDRSNGRDAVWAVHTVEYEVAGPMFRAFITQDAVIKDLKDDIKQIELAFEAEAEEETTEK